MKNYRIDYKEIESKLNKLDKLVSNEKDYYQLKKMKTSYYNLLIYKYSYSSEKMFLKKLKYTFLKCSPIEKEFLDFLVKENIDYFEEDYLCDERYFLSLLNLSNQFKSRENKLKFPRKNIDQDQVFEVMSSYFLDFDDENIKEMSSKIIEDKDNFEIAKSSLEMNVGGICFFDPYFNDCYFWIKEEQSDFRYITTAHEIFHGIEGFSNPNRYMLDNNNHSLLKTLEIGPVAVQFLALEYLKDNNIISEEEYLKDKLVELKAINNYCYGTVEYLDALGVAINHDKSFIISDGFEMYRKNLEACKSLIVGYGIYDVYKKDKQKGLTLLNDVTSGVSDSNETNITFSDNELLNYTKMIMDEQRQMIKILQKK